jgi:hypothetical protein
LYAWAAVGFVDVSEVPPPSAIQKEREDRGNCESQNGGQEFGGLEFRLHLLADVVQSGRVVRMD